VSKNVTHVRPGPARWHATTTAEPTHEHRSRMTAASTSSAAHDQPLPMQHQQTKNIPLAIAAAGRRHSPHEHAQPNDGPTLLNNTRQDTNKTARPNTRKTQDEGTAAPTHASAAARHTQARSTAQAAHKAENLHCKYSTDLNNQDSQTKPRHKMQQAHNHTTPAQRGCCCCCHGAVCACHCSVPQHIPTTTPPCPAHAYLTMCAEAVSCITAVTLCALLP
jgi:hypothetical protein